MTADQDLTLGGARRPRRGVLRHARARARRPRRARHRRRGRAGLRGASPRAAPQLHAHELRLPRQHPARGVPARPSSSRAPVLSRRARRRCSRTSLGARDVVFAMGYEDVTILDEARMLDYLEPVLGTPERALRVRAHARRPRARATCSRPSPRSRDSTSRRSSCGARATSSSSSRGRTGSATHIGGAERGRRDPGRQAVLARRAPRRPRAAPPPPLELGRRVCLRPSPTCRAAPPPPTTLYRSGPKTRKRTRGVRAPLWRGGASRRAGTVPAVQIGLTMFVTDQTMDARRAGAGGRGARLRLALPPRAHAHPDEPAHAAADRRRRARRGVQAHARSARRARRRGRR